jgi:hypothetical protein
MKNENNLPEPLGYSNISTKKKVYNYDHLHSIKSEISQTNNLTMHLTL